MAHSLSVAIFVNSYSTVTCVDLGKYKCKYKSNAIGIDLEAAVAMYIQWHLARLRSCAAVILICRWCNLGSIKVMSKWYLLHNAMIAQSCIHPHVWYRLHWGLRNMILNYAPANTLVVNPQLLLHTPGFTCFASFYVYSSIDNHSISIDITIQLCHFLLFCNEGIRAWGMKWSQHIFWLVCTLADALPICQSPSQESQGLFHTTDNANASVPVNSKEVLWVSSLVGCSMNWMEIDSQLGYCMPWPFGYLHMWADWYLLSGRCNEANLQCIICFCVNCIFNFGFGHTPWGLHWRLDWLIKNILKGSPVQRAVG